MKRSTAAAQCAVRDAPACWRCLRHCEARHPPAKPSTEPTTDTVARLAPTLRVSCAAYGLDRTSPSHSHTRTEPRHPRMRPACGAPSTAALALALMEARAWRARRGSGMAWPHGMLHEARRSSRTSEEGERALLPQVRQDVLPGHTHRQQRQWRQRASVRRVRADQPRE